MKRTLQTLLFALIAITMPIGMWAQESTVEAKWGASAESLTNEGTLAQAIDAAAESNAVAYIQLQSDVTKTDGFYISSGTFTLDLNSRALTSNSYAVEIQNEGTNVTITDNSEMSTGKIVSTLDGAAAIFPGNGASLTITGGSYESPSMALFIQTDCSVTITGGSFTGGGGLDIIHNVAGNLTISGGSFGGKDFHSSVYIGETSVNTITGGTFAYGTEGSFTFSGGKLDLTGYPTTNTEGTALLNSIILHNDTNTTITVNDNTIALPSGYCFYNEHEQAVTDLESDSKYIIGQQEKGVEAKWGTSAESLTNEGTLAQAISAAAESNDVAYIQLQSDVYTVAGIAITYCSFTLDLNNHTLTSISGVTITLLGEGTNIVITDNSADAAGKVVSHNDFEAVLADKYSSLTITGGNYESAIFTILIHNGASATISGGSFRWSGSSSVQNSSGNLIISGGTFTGSENCVASVSTYNYMANTTITGGTFTNGTNGTIYYAGGKIDLTGYPTTEVEGTTPITEISIYNGYGITAVRGNTTALPAGYCFYNSEEQAVNTLEFGLYTIGAEPAVKYTVTYAANDGLGTTTEEAAYGGNYILPECTFTAPVDKQFKAWQIGETEYQPGAAITVDANTTVIAVWTDYVPKIFIEMTDNYGDGWNDAAIVIKKDGVEIENATINDGKTATAQCDYDNTCEYTFYWKKGLYDGECSFVIKIEDETILTVNVGDCDSYEDGQLIHTIEALTTVETLTIADGELTEYINSKETCVGTLTYTRTLPNTEWNSLYVPFEIPVNEELLADYEVAYANNMHAYDTDNNGEIDKLEMEVIKIMQGTLHANHPYFIRAKSEAAQELTLTLEDALIHITKDTVITCQSFYTTFALTGIYSAMDAEDFAAIDGKHYAISTEGGWWGTEGLGAFRVYMTITEREGSPVKVSEQAMRSVGISVAGEETTGVEEMNIESEETAVYDLQGRKVENPDKGIYIVNGKKILVK